MKKILIISLITTFSLAQPVTSHDTIQQSLTIGITHVTLTKGDITQQKVDAIVNAANENLSHGGGVAHAISKAAGKRLQEHSNNMPFISNGERCPIGKAVITPAFDLEQIGIKKIIHATGPRGTTPNKEQLLYNTYTNSLRIAQENGLKSVAFPAISTAIFGYDIDAATPVALKAIQDFIIQYPHAFTEIKFIVFSEKDFIIYQTHMNRLFNNVSSMCKINK